MKVTDAYQEFLEGLFGAEPPAELLSHLVESGKRLFCDPHGLAAFAAAHAIEPYCVGEYLGEDERGFRPSPSLIVRASAFAGEGRRAVLNAKGSWLFACGRDVFGQAVVEGSPQNGERVFVFDESGACLGLGLWTADAYDRKNKNRPVIKTLVDIGAYVRREMTRKK